MTDTSVMQDSHRPGLRTISSLLTMGAQSVARFTAAGRCPGNFPGGTEQEAEDPPTHQPAAPGVPAALGQDLGNLRGPSPPGAAAATGPAGPGQLRERGINVPSGCPAPARPTPGAAWWKLATDLVQELLAAKRDLDLPRQLRDGRFLLLDGLLPQGAEESEVLFTLIAERYERRSLWRQTWSSPSGSASLPTPSTAGRLTGSCTTPDQRPQLMPSNASRPRR